MVRYGKAHAFGIAVELSVSRVGLALQPNVESICAFGKVAALLIMAELCLNRSLTRTSSRLNRFLELMRKKWPVEAQFVESFQARFTIGPEREKQA